MPPEAAQLRMYDSLQGVIERTSFLRSGALQIESARFVVPTFWVLLLQDVVPFFAPEVTSEPTLFPFKID